MIENTLPQKKYIFATKCFLNNSKDIEIFHIAKLTQ